MNPLFIIEHLEPKMWPWCIIEYKHMSKIVGKQNLLITNTKSKLMTGFAKTEAKSIGQLNPKNACILDPAATKTLTPTDAKQFDCFIFGGILGDDPPQERTKEELGSVPGERRNLGNKQMSTDTAIHVVWKIVHGMMLKEMQFQDTITLKIGNQEEIILPYRYLLKNNKPILAPGLEMYLKKMKGF